MKNRLKGLTLLETVLYIGLFSIIILIVLNFMLSTQEATLRTQRKASLHQASQFVIQHITDTFNHTESVNTQESVLEEDNGKLVVVYSSENKVYEIQNSRLLFNGTYITPKNIYVDKFYIVPIFKGEDNVIAVRITVELRSVGDSKLKETINLLFTIR